MSEYKRVEKSSVCDVLTDVTQLHLFHFLFIFSVNLIIFVLRREKRLVFGGFLLFFSVARSNMRATPLSKHADLILHNCKKRKKNKK